MIYTITIIGVILVFAVEFLIQKHESSSITSFFKSVSLYKTIEQILIVVLSATIAIVMTNAAEEKKVRDQYIELLENVYTEVALERSFLDQYINEDPAAQAALNASEDMFDVILRRYDMSVFLNNVINTNEAALTLGPYLYRHIMDEMNYRDVLLEAFYSRDYEMYGGRIGCLMQLRDTDEHLEALFIYQAAYLRGGNEQEYANKFLQQYYYANLPE